MGRRLGIITGSGPEAGIDLWSKVLQEQRIALGSSYRGDIDAPDVTMLSVPELGHSMGLPETADLVWSHLQPTCERIASQVDRFAIACNTLYYFEDAINDLDLPAQLVSPVDCVRFESERRDGLPMALLGAAPVTNLAGDTSPYANLVGSVDLELHPDPGRVHALIESIKLEGGSTPILEAEFQAIAAGLESDVAILACTELPLLATDGIEIDLVDVTSLLARELVNTD